MTQLYAPADFDRLIDEPWDSDRVRDKIAAIVKRIDGGYRDETSLWPANEWDRWQAPDVMKNVYVGAAGVVWALDGLYRRGFAGSKLDLPHLAVQTLHRFRDEPDYMTDTPTPEPRAASLLCGEAGILLVAWRLNRSDELADELFELTQANVDNDADELMWGAPGTMIAAHAMAHSTREQRWTDVWNTSADALVARRNDDGTWTQHLYGETTRFLGPAHGAVGNVLALKQGDDDKGAVAETKTLLRKTAVVEDGHANWPPNLDGNEPSRLQWCHGAPGVVHAAGDYLDEDLLVAGAELTWSAGPHNDEKGPGICHGTAGNGYAFLKAFERTGDEKWLDRARRFAMHAFAQAERMEPRYSLWTGDLGVAIYASDCLAATSRYPIIETLD